MPYKSMEVDLENGRVRPLGTEPLPLKAHALLTFLHVGDSGPAMTCLELASRWATVEKLSKAEAELFAKDIEASRLNLGRPTQ
jgi:hypothetical protein